jgi:hypothetical protein
VAFAAWADFSPRPFLLLKQFRSARFAGKNSFTNETKVCSKLRLSTVSAAVISFHSSFSSRGQRRQDQGAKQGIDFVRRKRAFTLHPPIQHKDESRGEILDQKIRRNALVLFSGRLEFLPNVIRNEIRDDFLKMLMDDRSSSQPNIRCARLSVLMNMFEDGSAESNDPFIPFS